MLDILIDSFWGNPNVMQAGFWLPMLAMTGLQMAGGIMQRNNAKKAMRKNRSQSIQQRKEDYAMQQEGNQLFGPYSATDPTLNYFQLSQQSDAQLKRLLQNYNLTPEQTEQTYYKKRGGLSGMLGKYKRKTRMGLDREAAIAALMQKSGRPDAEFFQLAADRFRDAQPYTEVSAYEDVPTMYGPMQEQVRETAEGIFDDSLTDRRVSFYEPVFDARQATVDQQKQADREALQDTLGNLDAQARRKGYSGDSLAEMQVAGRARQASARSSSKMQTLVDLQNQTDVLNERMKGESLKLNNLNLPTQMAANEAKMRMMPLTASTDAAVMAQQPLGFYKQRPNAPQLSRLPQHQAVPGTGEILMQAGANLMGGYLKDQANQEYMKGLQQVAAIQASSGRPVAGPPASDPNFRFFNYGQQQQPAQGLYNRSYT